MSTQATDTLPDESQKAASTETGATGAEPQDEGTLFLDADSSKYESAEDAIAGIKEKDAKIAADGERHATDNARIQDLEERIKSNEALTKVAEALQAQAAPSPLSDADRQAQEKALYEEINADPGKMVQHVADIANDSETRTIEAVKKMLEDHQASLTGQIQTVEGKVRDTDTYYVSRQEEVDTLEKDHGLSRDGAIAVQKLIDAAGGNNEVRPDIPGNTQSTRVTTDAPQSGISDAERAELSKRYTAEEIADLEKMDKYQTKATV